METYKKMYYKKFCERCTKGEDELKGFIRDRKTNILHCYAGITDTELGNKIVDVILVDACFVIQLFLLNIEEHTNDYILRSEWLKKAVEHELILFENQLPYFLLEELYEFAMPAVPLPESQEPKVEGNESSRDNQQYSSCSTGPRDHPTSVDQSGKTAKPRTFLQLTWKFFKDYSKGKSEVKPKHFTDLIRYFLCTPPEPTEPPEPESEVKEPTEPPEPESEVKRKHFTDLVRCFLCTPPEPTMPTEPKKEIKISVDNDVPIKSEPESEVKRKHFTDLVRCFLCTPPEPTKPTEPKKEIKIPEDNDVPIKSKYDIRKLTAAGVEFKRLDEGTVHYVIEEDSDKARKCKFNLPCFRNMKLKLTQFCVKYETECVIRNVMALEQILYPREPRICSYFLLMDQLVDTVEDVDLLVEKQIIVNLLGSNKAVMKLVNSLCEQIKEDKSFYSDICAKLNTHYENSTVNRSLANLKGVYFKDLWTSSSTVLGVVVLLFSVVGTIKSLMS